MTSRDVFNSLSPIDYRYWDKDVAGYLSENAFTRYKCDVEVMLVRAIHRRGLCAESVVAEIEVACEQVTTEEVYAEEKRIGHDIRALVNCIGARLSDDAKRFVHMMATSFDISDTANAARYRDCVTHVVLPTLLKLQEVLTTIAVREAKTVQIGRTHGQHAVPITFGFAIAGHVSRLGSCIVNIERRAGELVGKFSGAVGAYNASSLFFDDPDEFEREVLAGLQLSPADHSTQIVPPEPLIRLLMECALAAGVMADLADDMRHLQRTEIGEVGETFEAEQVGSSTMPQKRNPINFENVKSCWKIMAPRILTVLMDQLSEHQRDLTNSASVRTYGEVLSYLVSMTKRLTKTMEKLRVDHENVRRNVARQGDLILAEPLYILLAAAGHSHAHEAVRRATQRARAEAIPLMTAASADPSIERYLQTLSNRQCAMLQQPEVYTGIAAERAVQVAEYWSRELGLEDVGS